MSSRTNISGGQGVLLNHFSSTVAPLFLRGFAHFRYSAKRRLTPVPRRCSLLRCLARSFHVQPSVGLEEDDGETGPSDLKRATSDAAMTGAVLSGRRGGRGVLEWG